MLRIKTVAIACPKGGDLMKRVLIGGFSLVAMIVGVSAANAQANINPNQYPGNTSGPYGKPAPYEWYGAPGPNKRGNMCVTHVDPLRGYGFQQPCPAPKKAAAPPAVRHKKKKVAAR
jgi:hypothetical protein